MEYESKRKCQREMLNNGFKNVKGKGLKHR